jgi:hypothetical protein
MRVTIAVGAALAAVGLTAIAAAWFDLSFERATVLAPVVVLTAGAAAFLVLLWSKVVWESFRRRRPVDE